VLFHGKQTGQIKKVIISGDESVFGVAVKVGDPSGASSAAGWNGPTAAQRD
jgi:hypothetical protein